jgi:hypothetical protein
MKRSGFKAQRPPGSRPPRVAKQIGPEYTLRPRAVAVAVEGPARAAVAVPKEGAIQHQGYMAAVRQLPCLRCGVWGFTQFCHADDGKGLALKTDCRRGWPGCGPHGTIPGCHWLVGTSGQLGKAGRRDFEDEAGRLTRNGIRFMGQWPADLPAWPGDEVTA